MSDGMPILEIKDVHKRFRIPLDQRRTVREHALAFFRARQFKTHEVLKGVSFEVARGSTFGVMGRNGSGKSTLLKIVAGIYQPDQGQVVRRGRITPVLELGVGWNPELNAVDNIYLLGTVMGMTLREVRRVIDDILDFGGIKEFAALELKHYSSGMAARLSYAVAFWSVRDVLILDEVFAVGDVGFRDKCYDRYKKLHADGHTVLLVSHNPSDIATYCERAILVDDGRIVVCDTGASVAEAYVKLLGGSARATD